jgi:ring-1,2-phenylacetyl-CoA epoxidase subunit PaaD
MATVGRGPSAVGRKPAVAVTRESIYAALESVKDPEVPVLSVVELGIVRDVELDASGVTVVITPTYSGCPAMQAIEHDILATLRRAKIHNARVRTVLSPAWTTDWIPFAAREKLAAYGIAPPGHSGVHAPVQLKRRERVPCPFCGSDDTVLRSDFGSTACKALHQCNACRQPFEEFKAI